MLNDGGSAICIKPLARIRLTPILAFHSLWIRGLNSRTVPAGRSTVPKRNDVVDGSRLMKITRKENKASLTLAISLRTHHTALG